MIEQEAERQIYTQTAQRLNQAFDSGASAWDMVGDLRIFSKPILVDIEHTLLTLPNLITGVTGTCNTMAFRAIQELREVGTVIYLSNHAGQDKLKTALVDNGLWYPDTVLMSRYRWHPKFTDPTGPTLPSAQRVIGDFNLKYGQDLNYFEYGLKRVAPLFFKSLEIPLIDDSPDFTQDNFQILGLRIKPIITDPEREIDMVNLAKSSDLDLMDAVHLVRKHYKKSPNRLLQEKTPFRDSLVLTEFDKLSSFGVTDVGHTRIMCLINSQNTIVRVRPDPDLLSERDFMGIGEELALLEDKYSIAVPRHDVVVGPSITRRANKTYYLITDRIHGQSLDKKIYLPEEVDLAVEKLDELYSNIARYGWDKYLNGGLIIDDISFGNEQFVWGYREGESTDKIWLTDVGPQMLEFHKRSHELFLIQTRLFDMILQSERKLGRRLDGARENIIALFKTITEQDPFYWRVLELRRLFGDTSAGTLEEDKQELQKRLSPYLESLQSFTLSESDWEEIAQDALKSEARYLAKALETMGTDQLLSDHYIILNLNSFKEREKDLFRGRTSYRILERLALSIGEETYKLLTARFGGHNVDSLLEPIANRLQKELNRKYSLVTSHLHDRMHAEIIRSLKWDEDIMARLLTIKDLVGYKEFNNHYLPKVESLLGWDFKFPLTKDALKELFSKSGLEQDEFEWSCFVVDQVDKEMQAKLTQHLKELEDKYGEDTMVAVKEGLAEREADKILDSED